MSEITPPTVPAGSRHFGELSWRSFIKDTLSDVDGTWSSKRVFTAIGMSLFVILFFANLLFKMMVDSTIMNVLASIILSGLAVTVAERFGKSFSDQSAPPGSGPGMQRPPSA